MFARALELTTPTLKQLAKELGVKHDILRRYRIADRQPTPDLARRLAKVMRKRAQKLEREAARLENAADDEGTSQSEAQ